MGYETPRQTGGGVTATVIQNASYTYAEDAEANDSYAIALDPAPDAYAAGQTFRFKANTANTGAATLNVNSLGAKTIKKNNDQDLATGDIEAGAIVTVTYDGTNFQLESSDNNLTFDEIADGATNVGYTSTEKTKLSGIEDNAEVNTVTPTNAVTLTNKRITPRVGTVASSATPTPVGDSNDMYTVTALATGATIGAPTGTPTDGQKIIIRILDDGGGESLSFNAIYRAVGVELPTTTTADKTIYLGCIYNDADSVWDVIAVAEEA